MIRFAIVEYGVVQNVITAENIEIAETITGKIAIPNDTAEIGFFYNEETGEFSDTPPVDESIQPPNPPVEPTPVAE